MRKIVKKKRRNFSKKMQKGSIGNFFIFVILILLIILAFNAIGGLPSTENPTSGTVVHIKEPAQDNSHNTLQLQTFGFTTISPTNTGVPQQTVNTPPGTIIPPPPFTAPRCGFDDDNGVLVNNTCKCLDLDVICKNGKGYTDDGRPFTIPAGDAPPGYKAGQDPCGTRIAPGEGRYCVAKPVIYLYPTTPTWVSVQVITSGKVVVSDPLYPQGGWNVLAQPDGTLAYQNQKYTELFYESSVTDFQKPDTGVTIATDQLAQRLNEILTQLGLVGHEKQEFLSYWLPRLQNLNTPYIYFSLLDTSAKATVDNVVISPKPDTQIAFIAYFKGVTKPVENTLQLQPMPKRVGFVSVEWGGVLDK
jgi:hypothetical protein